MKNLKPSAGILFSILRVMKLCFLALSMVSVSLFTKPVFASSHHFFSAVFPRVRERFSAWLTPVVMYVIVNCIILAIFANSNLQHGFKITGSSHKEDNPSAALAHQKQQHRESIYDEEKTQRSGATELELEEEAVEVETPLATLPFKSASAKSAKSLPISRSKKQAETLDATWMAITEGRQRSPLTRHLRKSETWETVHRADATEGPSRDSSSSSSSVFQKSEAWSNASNRTRDKLVGKPELAVALRKEPSPGQDELNRRVEAFISKTNNDMKLQREQSLLHYMEMVDRGVGG